MIIIQGVLCRFIKNYCDDKATIFLMKIVKVFTEIMKDKIQKR